MVLPDRSHGVRGCRLRAITALITDFGAIGIVVLPGGRVDLDNAIEIHSFLARLA